MFTNPNKDANTTHCATNNENYAIYQNSASECNAKESDNSLQCQTGINQETGHTMMHNQDHDSPTKCSENGQVHAMDQTNNENSLSPTKMLVLLTYNISAICLFRSCRECTLL